MDDNDHRAIANRMDLFHQQEEGPGMVFWHPRGFALYRIIEDTIRERMKQAGFHEIRTPQLLARELWEKSGHWEKFAGNMFVIDDDERAHALKPMSCPAHVQVFNKRVRSFRDLPLRLAEFGACHRNEPSGALYGLMRTRAFVQDDAHIFCAPDDVEAEVARFCHMLFEIYADFGFDDIAVAFSTRPDKRAGSDDAWDRAEARLLEGEAPPILRDVLLDRSARTYILHQDEASRETARKLAGRMLGAQPTVHDAADSALAGAPALVFGSPDQVDEFITRFQLPPRPVKIAGQGSGRAWVAQRDGGKAVLFVEADGPDALQAMTRPLPHYRSRSFVTFDGSRAIDKGVWPSAGGPLAKALD